MRWDVVMMWRWRLESRVLPQCCKYLNWFLSSGLKRGEVGKSVCWHAEQMFVLCLKLRGKSQLGKGWAVAWAMQEVGSTSCPWAGCPRPGRSPSFLGRALPQYAAWSNGYTLTLSVFSKGNIFLQKMSSSYVPPLKCRHSQTAFF